MEKRKSPHLDGMQTIEVTVSVGLVGCTRKETFEIESGASDEGVEEMAREVMFNLVEWSWKVLL